VVVSVAPLQIFLTALAGWLSGRQQNVIGLLTCDRPAVELREAWCLQQYSGSDRYRLENTVSCEHTDDG
jgi:hypothetical protein